MMIDLVRADHAMYEINCSDCVDIGFHPSRVGAESRGERHAAEFDHDCTVRSVDVSTTSG